MKTLRPGSPRSEARIMRLLVRAAPRFRYALRECGLVANGDFYSDHRHGDSGQVSIYAHSAPLAIDWNANLYYPHVSGGMQHNRVMRESESGRRGTRTRHPSRPERTGVRRVKLASPGLRIPRRRRLRSWQRMERCGPAVLRRLRRTCPGRSCVFEIVQGTDWPRRKF